MRFCIVKYYDKLIQECKEKNIAHESWFQVFTALGYTSYVYYGYDDGKNLPQYLSEEEFVIFALRYG